MKALEGFAPRLGIVLGSGLGGIADALTDATAIPYAELEGFPQPSVAGHGGTLFFGALGGLPVAVFQGRKHVYETGDATGMQVPIRTLQQLGAEALLVTNAAGSLNAHLGPGRLMMISDHINLLGVNPLTGPNDDAIGPRFPSLRDAYDPALRAELRAAAERAGDRARRGRLPGDGRTDLRDPGRDPRVPHARGGRGRDVYGSRGDPGPSCRPAGRRGVGDHEPCRGDGRRGALARADVAQRRGRGP